MTLIEPSISSCYGATWSTERYTEVGRVFMPCRRHRRSAFGCVAGDRLLRSRMAVAVHAVTHVFADQVADTDCLIEITRSPARRLAACGSV